VVTCTDFCGPLTHSTRSAAVVFGYCIRHLGYGEREALRVVTAMRPQYGHRVLKSQKAGRYMAQIMRVAALKYVVDDYNTPPYPCVN
jgi:hypothetical protein